jgi:hypothetical protein
MRDGVAKKRAQGDPGEMWLAKERDRWLRIR